MANADYRTASNTATIGRRVSELMEVTIDFTKNTHVATDVLSLFTLNKGDFVRGAFVEVLTAEGESLTGDLGITGGDTDGFLDGVNLNATGYTVMKTTLAENTPNDIVGYSAGHMVTADDTVVALLIATAATNANTAVIRVGIVVDHLG